MSAVEDMVLKPLAQIARVDQLLRIDPRGRAAGDVADIVGAGSARGQPQFLQLDQEIRRILWRDLADLEVIARRHMRIATAHLLRKIGKAAHLAQIEHAMMYAQPAHKGLAPAPHGTGRNTWSERHRRL